MPRLRRFYGEGHYHYLTENIYRRARIFDSDRFRRKFVQTLDDLRTELGFKIFAYVLMPEHCHLLIGPSSAANRSHNMPKLSERTANFILRNLRQNLSYPWCQKPVARRSATCSAPKGRNNEAQANGLG
jgi:putative transposase